ncbi:MAG TPA: molybdopterin-dependent oxidoreductase [Candidatus Limnocylindrales bacterium]|nr:molybdopterin-dependent oxidoreductase [Candidatus Limnocylindrales bacterium]
MCIQYTRLKQPAPAPENAAFALIGAVAAPCVWSLDDLRQRPQHSRRVTLLCDAEALNPRRWMTREWSGVPLAALLREAGVRAEAQSVQVAGYDGRLSALALTDVKHALLALAADGQPLNAEQGFPARLILPGCSACAMPRYVQRIAVSAEGASPLAYSQPRAVITRAVRESGFAGVRLAGLAVGGAYPLESVAMRLDSGPPVLVPVAGGAPGLAGTWALDWPGEAVSTQQFSVQPWPEGESIPVANPDKSVARRWQAEIHQVKVSAAS